MDNDHRHHGSGFMNGFVLGAIIGAGAVFLLGTKKGRQVLSTLTENGFESVSELKEMFDTDGFDDSEEEYTAEGALEEEPKHDVSSVSRPIKRFFRGIKK